ncbi:MAG TPA: hypothetical protein VH370_25645 [Humisphaera sp.]|nr:hypothetical protein [Humisphaera sp.]
MLEEQKAFKFFERRGSNNMSDEFDPANGRLLRPDKVEYDSVLQDIAGSFQAAVAKAARRLRTADVHDKRDLADRLYSYLSWYSAQRDGRDFLDRQFDSSCGESKGPLEVETFKRVLESLRSSSMEEVPWDRVQAILEAHGLSEVQAFHPAFTVDGTGRHFSFAEPELDEQLDSDPIFMRRSRLFQDLALVNQSKPSNGEFRR